MVIKWKVCGEDCNTDKNYCWWVNNIPMWMTKLELDDDDEYIGVWLIWTVERVAAINNSMVSHTTFAQ